MKTISLPVVCLSVCQPTSFPLFFLLVLNFDLTFSFKMAFERNAFFLKISDCPLCRALEENDSEIDFDERENFLIHFDLANQQDLLPSS